MRIFVRPWIFGQEIKVVVTSNKNDLNKNCWMILVENCFSHFKICYETLRNYVFTLNGN